MGADGSRGPKPYEQKQASTIFLRVPAADWAAVKQGRKTEFRGQPGMVSGLKWVEPPTPVVAYSYSRTRGYDQQLMVLEDRYTEPLMGITPEALAREGFPDVAHFRRYMMQREGKRFSPTLEVTAYVLRAFTEADVTTFSRRLLEHLYGAFLPAPLRPTG